MLEPPHKSLTVRSWPLARDIIDCGRLTSLYAIALDGESFYRAEAHALRALRTSVASESGDRIFVREGCDMTTFALHVRDEFPSAFGQRLHDFVARAWAREPPAWDDYSL
jgi:hypothetical protein